MPAPPAGPFRPSTHGCEFGNAETTGLPIRIGRLPVAMVTGGLCGGMVLDSLRSWRLGRAPAGRSTADLTRVFGAQLRSFQVPTGPWQYLRLQQPGAIGARAAATRRAAQEIRRQVVQGRPVPVALVCRLSRNPFALSAHHVVLAYEVREEGAGSATFAVYDPNHPGDDDVLLRVAGDQVEHSRRRGVRAVFVLRAR